ncbi:MAG TPA: phosphoglucosamine mutase [Clostridia bacterium]|nr:phosphoglucosamine mutase [Clostridia bacterium]
MRKLFGTDGVRGIANQELTSDLAFKLGQAAAYVLAGELSHKPRILVGTDTRISCDMLECALDAGLCSVGADVISLGIIPTPGVAYLTALHKADAGVVISASHNSYEFNGIKFFDSEGYKLPDELEKKIEDFVFSDTTLPHKTGSRIGRIYRENGFLNDYIDYLVSNADSDVSGLRILLDLANGAAFRVAPEVFRRLGAAVDIMNGEPDGININENCGSTHIEGLCTRMSEGGHDLGFAYDGDADRMIAVSEDGRVISGDKILGALAVNLRKKRRLQKDTLVVTVMSNMGLDVFARDNGINIIKTQVGDRYVVEEMRRNGFSLGGEQSGHVIQRDCNSTGDGILTSLRVADILIEEGTKASHIHEIFKEFPQVMMNVQVPNSKKKSVLEDNDVFDKIKSVEDELKGEGRVILRPSGTEPLVRVMMEGRDMALIQRKTMEMAEFIALKFGKED